MSSPTGASATTQAPVPAAGALPLFRRFPGLACIPRAAVGTFPSPVQQVTVGDVSLWLKRDDLDASSYGGNKVRALEFLLGGIRPGDEVLTVGGEGSTHVLATAAIARQLGARVVALRWTHEMNPTARLVGRRAAELCSRINTAGVPAALLRLAVARLGGGRRWIPLGGSSPVGILGHVNAGLELAEQVAQGTLPAPARVVVPLGSGGTAAGLALGFAVAGLDAVVVGARVAPRVGSNRARVLWLARRTGALIERITGGPVRQVHASSIEVVHDVYGGAYGRALPDAGEAALSLGEATGVRLDETYSAKALVCALALARRRQGDVLFWVTFDARWMEEAGEAPC